MKDVLSETKCEKQQAMWLKCSKNKKLKKKIFLAYFNVLNFSVSRFHFIHLVCCFGHFISVEKYEENKKNWTQFLFL